MDAKLLGEKLMRNEIFTVSTYLFTKYLLIKKGERTNL